MTGHALVCANYCDFNIDKLQIDFHGGASWLYNLFSGVISNELKGSIDTQVYIIHKEQERDSLQGIGRPSLTHLVLKSSPTPSVPIHPLA